MDIPSLSMQVSQSNVASSFNIAMICNAKDQMESNSAQLLKAMESMSVGSTGALDVSV